MVLYVAAIVSYLGIFASSTFMGWSSPVLPLYERGDSPFHLSGSEGAWVASLNLLGAAVGPPVCLLFAHSVGRKTLLIFSVLPFVIGCITIAFATSVYHLYFARFISGMGTGTAICVMPMYLGEISPPHRRGSLLAFIIMSSRLGILFAYAVYPFVSIAVGALVSMILPLVYVLSFIFLPESPYHWMRKGKRDAAAKSLIRLRGTKDIQEELDRIETSVKAEMANSGGFRELLFVPGNRTSLFVSVVLGVIQQLSGSQAIMLYAQNIFDAAHVAVAGKYMAIILGVVQLFFTGVCGFLVDYFGRRPLLLSSTVGSLVSTTIIAAYFHLKSSAFDTSHIEWLPATGCMLYVVFYSLGLAPLPTAMTGELFPTNTKSLGCATAVFCTYIVGFGVGKVYQIICDSVGTHVGFWIFAVCNVIGIIYIYFFVPETKGKTLQEIQEDLNRRTSVISMKNSAWVAG
ncbi:facilitated trehalose transporter Tret1-2 homolog [Diachasma alloeum]|uniref:facilitated trehalose transporter Tret1-2 homolog n=1 Tax=Diachasma alloeum TaxID=454923 RepID=UPI000738102B|nr:facilitated trehalose transporter Tret1-2 homolog [Diachasma alloeum]